MTEGLYTTVIALPRRGLRIVAYGLGRGHGGRHHPKLRSTIGSACIGLPPLSLYEAVLRQRVMRRQ